MDESLSFEVILERVCHAISQALDIEVEAVRADQSIFELSNKDDGYLVAGLHMIEAHAAVSDEFHIAIADEELDRLETPYDLARYISGQLNPLVTPPASPPEPPKRPRRTAARQKPKAALSRPGSWIFDHGQWESGPQRNTQEDGDTSTSLLRLGARERGFAVTVFAHTDQSNGPENCAYRVQLWIGDEANTLFVADLPSLLSLLGRLAPITQSTKE